MHYYLECIFNLDSLGKGGGNDFLTYDGKATFGQKRLGNTALVVVLSYQMESKECWIYI